MISSELDFQQEEDANQINQPDEIDDDYIEDEFEQSLAEEAKNDNNILQPRSAVTPDLGNVAKVAKKEGVIEVIEVDDGKEKALSSGS